VALQLLRAIEEMLLKSATHNLNVRTRSEVALYLLNHKRAHLRALEERFHIGIVVDADAGIGGQVSFLIEKGEQVHSLEQARALVAAGAAPADQAGEADEEAETAESEAVAQEHSDEEVAEEPLPYEGQPQDAGTGRRRRRRRRGRRDGREDGGFARPPTASGEPDGDVAGDEPADFAEPHPPGPAITPLEPTEANGEGESRRRRRGRRGGRRFRRENEGPAVETGPEPVPDSARPEGVPAHLSDADLLQPALEPAAAAPVLPSTFVEQAELADTEAEAARSRSTVRERPLAPAPEETSQPASPAAPVSAEPVVSSSAEDQKTDRPPRSGWWSRRVLGRH
jgi:ribonuclease E